MGIFSDLSELGHEQLIFCRNDDVGLRAIIGLHSTALGPALGGVRLYNYANEADAVRDVLRLSRGMTYKAAVAGLDLGGGKAVILGDPSIKSEALFRAFGRHIESLGGRYITAEDMNTTVEDMNWIRRETRWVTGFGTAQGGSGDPSPVTAWGVYQGIRACLEIVFGVPEVNGRTVAIQGLGAVGFHLARTLHEHGAKLLFSDISHRKLKLALETFGGAIVDDEDYFATECDVLAPCAVGGVLNPSSIPRIRAPIVAGAANNQLDDEARDGEALEAGGIVYAPDYVINAGGLINVYAELQGTPHSGVMSEAGNIFNTVKAVINKARALRVTTTQASNQLAEERIAAIGKVRRMRIGG
jgi:leucine dehydrogenase